jgi:undecaprenyl-diphosphatase
VAGIASEAGLILLALIAVGLAAVRVVRNREGLRRFMARLAEKPPFAWIRQRLPRQVAWLGGRLDPSRPQGILLTFALTVAALCGWAFGGLTQDVVAHDDLARIDPRFESFVAAHRAAWATGAMKSVTWLGSNVVLVPLVLIVGGYFVFRRRDWKPLGKLGASLLGAILLYDLVKSLVARARPPARLDVGYTFSGFSFPSGHATESLAVWGMLAILASAVLRRRRYMPFLLAIVVVSLVGASRIYLGAHWLSDVLGGYALGGLWLSLLMAVMLARAQPPSDDQKIVGVVEDAA